jgi:hypothetical protein
MGLMQQSANLCMTHLKMSSQTASFLGINDPIPSATVDVHHFKRMPPNTFSLHDCSFLTYLFVFNWNDMVQRNVVTKYHCFNMNWWRTPIQRTRFERFIASLK